MASRSGFLTVMTPPLSLIPYAGITGVYQLIWRCSKVFRHPLVDTCSNIRLGLPSFLWIDTAARLGSSFYETLALRNSLMNCVVWHRQSPGCGIHADRCHTLVSTLRPILFHTPP